MFDTFGKFKGPTPDWYVWYNNQQNLLSNRGYWGYSGYSSEELRKKLSKLCFELTEEQLALWKQQHNELLNEFNKWHNEQLREFIDTKEAMHAAMKKNGYYDKSSELKYLKNKIIFKPKRYPFNFEIIENARKQYAEILKKKEQELKQNSKVSAAVKYCLDAGSKLEEDFTLTTAINHANYLAREKAIKEASSSGGEVEHSCCDECSSWDPNEHRCSCGNRRMYWDSYGDFQNMYVFPAAD